jgi:type III pantothenate kinase
MQSLPVESAAGRVRLIADIGNTNTTLALFSGDSEPVLRTVPSAQAAENTTMREVLGSLTLQHGTPHSIAVCSVVPAVAAAGSALLQSFYSMPVLTIGSTLRLPFMLEYGNPQGFGADRIALCAWSRHLFSRNAVIAVDIGTAITFDVLGSDGIYRGGLIMPGIDMMAGALHARTAQLPLVKISKPEGRLGRSTEECIRSGIYWGAISQIGGLIEAIRADLTGEFGTSSVEVIVTGGNSRIIAPELGTVSVIDEHAVLRGSDLLLRMNM